MRPVDDKTLTPGMLDDMYEDDGTMISHSIHGTLVPDVDNTGELESNLGTMVINNDGDEDDFTMKRKFFLLHFVCLDGTEK